MRIIPQDWPDAFSRFSAESYDVFRAIPNKELLELKNGYKLLGQITFKNTEVRALIRDGNIFVQALPVEGTTHDLVEEYVEPATQEVQGIKLDEEGQKNLTYVMREQIDDAVEGSLAGLTPEYIIARTVLARYSPIKVVTTQQEMPKNAQEVRPYRDIRALSKKVAQAAIGKKQPTGDPEKKGEREILRIFGTTATLYKIPDKKAS